MGIVIQFPVAKRHELIRRERILRGTLADMERLLLQASSGTLPAPSHVFVQLAQTAKEMGGEEELMALLERFEEGALNPPAPAPEPAPTEREINAKAMGCSTGNGIKGNRYEETKRLPMTEIAKLIRKDIKEAIKGSRLPKGLKVSVRTNTYSGGGSIDVEIKALPESLKVLNTLRVKWTRDNPHAYRPPAILIDENDVSHSYDVYTPEMSEVIATLEAIHDSYNRDNSDSMSDYFDVRYYGRVTVCGTLETARRESILAELGE